MLKGVLIGVSGIAFLAIIATGVAYSLINQPTEIEEQITLAPSQPGRNPERFEIFEEEVRGTILVITEDDGVKLVDFAAEVKGIPIKGRIAEIEFVADRILVVIDAEVYGLEAKIGAAMKVEVEHGQPNIGWRMSTLVNCLCRRQ